MNNLNIFIRKRIEIEDRMAVLAEKLESSPDDRNEIRKLRAEYASVLQSIREKNKLKEFRKTISKNTP